MARKYTLEADVDDYVKKKLEELGLKKLVDYNEKTSMSEYMKTALKGAAKGESKKNFGVPDFHIEKYKLPIVIEDKLGFKRHIVETKQGIKMDEKSVKNYAVNGAIYYAKSMIASKKYTEAIAIGISGEDDDNIKISTYYVFSPSIEPKFMRNYNTLDFVQSEASIEAFYKEATVTEAEKHAILIKSREELLKHSKNLNKLMNNHNIGVDQRVVYVSGMLLSMQDVFDENGNVIDYGLVPEDLKGIQTDQKRDGVVIVNHIEEYLDRKNIPMDKRKIMLDSFKMSISLDTARDAKTELDPVVANLMKSKSSINKQIFTYLYENIYKTIDLSSGALDIMAEMYSTFLKYALSDGAQLGKVLTPPYITNLMAKLLDVNKDSRVMDIAAGSAAFLVASMDLMIEDANKTYGKNTQRANEKIDSIKHNQLLGIEVDAKMYTLAATNMILRGDGSSKIKKDDTFTVPTSLFEEFSADKLLLNPPFSYKDNGLPFFEFGLSHMEKDGIGAVIVQDSIGAGKGTDTTLKILEKHTMLASIKMPSDLFEPNATVQTSIYIFKAGRPHNFDTDIVKFIDFRNDGYKRTVRTINEVDHPVERYEDLYLIYKLGFNATNHKDFHNNLWNLKKIYCEDTISDTGKDWNFEQHIKIDNNPENGQFSRAIDDHLAWDIKEWISNNKEEDFSSLENKEMKEYTTSQVFDIYKVPSYNKDRLTEINVGDKVYDYITRTNENRGICERTGYIDNVGINEAGTFSLGLLQMKFYYRENGWYAGQFMRKIKCKYDIDKYAGIYLETVLNGLSNYLLSGLVRDVDKKFSTSKILLPTKNGEIDFEWMSEYVINRRQKVLKRLLKEYE